MRGHRVRRLPVAHSLRIGEHSMRPTLYNGRRPQLALVAALMVTQIHGALAHGLAGERFFPATILTDDPFVADEISLPQVSLQPPAPDASQLTNIEIDL